MFTLLAYLTTAKYYKRIVEKYDELMLGSIISTILCFLIDFVIIIILTNNL